MIDLLCMMIARLCFTFLSPKPMREYSSISLVAAKDVQQEANSNSGDRSLHATFDKTHFAIRISEMNFWRKIQNSKQKEQGKKTVLI